MQELLYIVQNISLPIIILILLGFLFQKIFKIGSKSFSKLIIFLIMPIVIFIKIYQADIQLSSLLLVAVFLLCVAPTLYLISIIISFIFKYDKSMRHAVTNSIILFNSGNYGLPLIELAFNGNSIATASQLFIIIIQSILGNTLGVYHATGNKTSKIKAFSNIIKMPSLYAIVLAFILKSFRMVIPNTIVISMNYMADSFIALALVTLGIQLSEIKFGGKLRDVFVTTAIRIIIAPLLGFAFVFLFDIKGVLAQALIIGISTPSAVNSAILAKEFKNQSDFASQVVLSTTVFATFTLPAIIYFLRQYFV